MLTDVHNISARLYYAKHEEDFFKAKYLLSMVPALIVQPKSGWRSRRDFNTRFHTDLITLWNDGLYEEVWAKAMKEQNKRKPKLKKTRINPKMRTTSTTLFQFFESECSAMFVSSPSLLTVTPIVPPLKPEVNGAD